MITIKLYQNGFEVIGHSDNNTCSQVSMLAWSYAMTIYRLDYSRIYYTSANDEDPKKHYDGYTWMIFDTNNFMARWMYEEYIINLKEWAEEIWKEKVRIKEIDEILVKSKNIA